MQKPSFDPGLTQKYTGAFRRVINPDGTFNVHRRGTTWRDFHPYLYLINMSWPAFLAALFCGYLAVNVVFALTYYAIGPEQLQGGEGPTVMERFLHTFFFSSHTLTTVGYGSIYPKGLGANIVSAFESLVGVLGFAVATGLLFGRVSRPSARIGFSENMLMAPYQDGTSLQFRIANRRQNSLMELQVRMLLMTVQTENGQQKRRYDLLKLERPEVLFLALTWTIVHPIDQESPFWQKTAEDLNRLQAEVLILIKGFDDTFNQTVLARYSYRHDEIVWGKRFTPAFSVNEKGDLILEVKKIGAMG
jgi:inward rectifier potassium channel